MTPRLASITILFVGLLHAAAMAAETAWTGITVRVYNTTELSSPDLRAALETAAVTLAGANVDVTWRLCPGGSDHLRQVGSLSDPTSQRWLAGPLSADRPGGPPKLYAKAEEQDPPYVRSMAGAIGSCDAPMDRGELAIRILRSPARSKDPGSGTLGDALIDARKREGVLGTLYFNRVQWLADAAGTNVSTLLGHAIAHELGHLLVATSAHSKHGLMRAVWSRAEVRRGSWRDWAFTKIDIAAIHRRVNMIQIGDRDSRLGTRESRSDWGTR